MNNHPLLKRSTRNATATAAALLLAFVSGENARAASLLLDFGPTTVAAADALLSPAHAINAVTNTEISWNKITADTSTLVYGNGSAATGVSLDIGRSQAGVDTIDYNDNGFSTTLAGSAVNTGVYAGTSPVRDGFFGGSGGGNNLALGIRVNGLPAGPYTIYFTGRNSNTGVTTSLSQRFYLSTGSSATTFSFSTANPNVLVTNFANPVTTGSFVEGNNYGSMTFTLGAGDSLFLACEGTDPVELRGFLSSVEIVTGLPSLPARVGAQPANKTVLEGGSTLIASSATGTAPLYAQWRFNGADLPGQTNTSLLLTNVSPSLAGTYRLYVSNQFGTDLSSNAVLTVTPTSNTGQMTNIWNLFAGDRVYLGTAATERGIAINPVTHNLLLVSRSPSESLVVLDPDTGAQKYFMDVTGVGTTTGGTVLGLNIPAVADDGVVYAANLTVNASSPPYVIYRWPDDSTNNQPAPVFIGDPAGAVQPGLRWGDNFTVRGAGADTQILIAPGSGTNVVLLRTVSGLDFQTEVPPAVISVTGVPSGFAALGISFGPGTNTFWAKTSNNSLYLVQYDLNSSTGAVLYTYSTAQMPGTVRGIAADKGQKFLVGLSVEATDNVRLYDVSDLVLGPVQRDQEVFTNPTGASGAAATAIGNNYVFALDANVGIKAFRIDTNYVPPSISIIAQPTNRVVYEGQTTVFSSVAAGPMPIFTQWRFNGADIPGATSNTLTLTNISASMAGNYTFYASNSFATITSSNAVLTVIPVPNTPQMTNIWNLLPGDRVYLGTGSTERGLAFNPVTTNLLLVSRSPSESVVVLDALTGAEKHFLDVSGIPASTAGVSLGLNAIGVGDDGVVYGGSVTISASSPPYDLYRWQDDSTANSPILVFAGDPAAAVEPNLRYGDTMAVRGAGTNTQILLAPGSGTNVVLLRSISGFDFQTEIPPAVISVSGVPSAFAQLGIAFGPGTNTFWAKTVNNQLFLIQFDLNSNTGSVLHAYSTNAVSGLVRSIAVDKNQKFLAGLSLEAADNVRLYDISNPNVDPIQRDEEVFLTHNTPGPVGGTGASAFGAGYLFVLDTNNGIKAFKIDESYAPPLGGFRITNVARAGSSVVLTWETSPGHSYVAQYKNSLTDAVWTDFGGTNTATGTSLSATNDVSASMARFFRVRGN